MIELHVVLVKLLVANSSLGRSELDYRTAGSVQGLIGQHLAIVVVVLPHSRGHPPCRFVSYDLANSNLTLDITTQLTNVLESSVLEELQYLAVPLIILGRVYPVVGWVDVLGEHPVGKARHHHYYDLLAEF